MITEIKGKITEIKPRDPLTEKIIGCAYKVHSELGPGFSEKIYHNALKIALKEEGLRYQTERQFKVKYLDREVGILRLDLIVSDKIVVEVKAISGILPKVFEAQVLAYLKITGCKVGLIINFGNRSCEVRRIMHKSL